MVTPPAEVSVSTLASVDEGVIFRQAALRHRESLLKKRGPPQNGSRADDLSHLGEDVPPDRALRQRRQVDLGFGRIVVSDIEAPNLLANLV
jgi:hypothetical protein